MAASSVEPETVTEVSHAESTTDDVEVDSRFVIDIVSQKSCLPDEKKDKAGRCMKKQK